MSGSGTFGTVLDGTFYGASVVSWHCRTHASSPFWALNPKNEVFAIRRFRSFPSENGVFQVSLKCEASRTYTVYMYVQYIFGNYIVIQCSDIISHRRAANICTYLQVAHTITHTCLEISLSMFTKAPSPPPALPLWFLPAGVGFGFDRKRGRQNAEFRQERTAPWWQDSEKKKRKKTMVRS